MRRKIADRRKANDLEPIAGGDVVCLRGQNPYAARGILHVETLAGNLERGHAGDLDPSAGDSRRIEGADRVDWSIHSSKGIGGAGLKNRDMIERGGMKI